MADANKDIEMKAEDQENDEEIDTLIKVLDGQKADPSSIPAQAESVDLEQVKSTLDRYKIDIFKGVDNNIQGIVKDLKHVLDKIDQGTMPQELDKIFPTLIRIWSERRFYKTEIDSQATINGFLQYWMYKRVKKQKLNKENFKALCQILSDDSVFYSLQHTSKSMEEMKKENEAVKETNGILVTHLEDFTETSRIVYSPFYLDNVNTFCKLDGFAQLIELLQDSSQNTSLEFLKDVLDICIPLKNYLKEEYRFQFFSGIIDQILIVFKAYSEEDLKPITQEDLEKFISCLEHVLEDIYEDKKAADEAIQSLEFYIALRFLNTPYIEKRVNGLNILISKVNLVNKSTFPCTWKRKVYYDRKKLYLTSDIFLSWLLDNDIFGLFFGETLHSELVVKYYAVLSFLYSKDCLNEKHLELIWDCAINKHDAYRVNILKVLSTLALRVKPSHAKFMFQKVKNMDLNEHCKFTLMLLKHLNKNVCKGPVNDQAAHEASFGKQRQQNAEFFDLEGLLDIKRVGQYPKKTRSLSLGGEEKEATSSKTKQRHNSPVASLRHNRGLVTDINIGPFEVTRFDDPLLRTKSKLEPLIDTKKPFFEPNLNKKKLSLGNEDLTKETPKEETKVEESKEETKDQSEAVPKVEDDKQSTDEEDLNKSLSKQNDNSEENKDSSDNFKLIKERLEKGFNKGKESKEESKKDQKPPVEQASPEVELSPRQKQIKDELKEESLELLWKMCQESTVIHGLNFSVHKGAIESFGFALHYNTNEVKWKYIHKIMERLQQNESVISIISVLRKFIQVLPEGDIVRIRNEQNPEHIDVTEFPKTRIELISKLDKDFALMNELMSLNIEFKRTTLDLIYDHLGRNVDREQSLETQSSLSASNDAEGEDTEEEEEVQTDAASRPSQQLSNNGNDDNDDNDDNDIEMKSGSKPQALSEDDGFIVPKKREVRNNMLAGRHSNNDDEEEKGEKRGANQSLSITDISMTDEDNKDKDLDRRFISKRSHSVTHRDPRPQNTIHETPVQNHRENDFLLNVETNSVYDMKYFSEVNERLEFIKYILKNSDEIIKPIHIKILWECHIESSFHERERAVFLEWLTSIIKIQGGYANTRRESRVMFDDDTIELIFFESLLCLDFVTLPEEAYECFEEYFVYINVQFGQLIKGNYSGSYEVFDTKLIGIQALWEIVLQSKDQKVHHKASKFLLTLYKKLSPDLFDHLNTIKEDFLKTCMSHIKEGVRMLNEGLGPEDKENAKNRVARSLDQICKFIDEFEGLSDRSKRSGGSSAPKVTLSFTNQMGLNYEPKKGELFLTKSTTIKELKKEL